MFILEGMLILKCPFNLNTKTINASQNTRTARWHDKAGLAYNAVNEVGPHVHTSLTGAAAFWHIHDGRIRQGVKPDIDICQHPLKRLRRLKSPSHLVLFLAQGQRPAALDGVSCLQTFPCFHHCPVFVAFPLTIAISPSRTDMMPFAIVGPHTHWSNGKRKRLYCDDIINYFSESWNVCLVSKELKMT